MPEPLNGVVLEPENGSNSALPQRRGGPGRPVGSKNKRSLDLARWIQHAFDGLTPGQQAASIALVSQSDIDAAPEAARALGVVDLGLSGLTLAMVVKATRLAKALRCDVIEAWAIMAKEREGLMRYVHQVQPPARELANRPPATVFLVPEGEAIEASLGQLPDDDADPDFIGFFDTAEARVGSDDAPSDSTD